MLLNGDVWCFTLEIFCNLLKSFKESNNMRLWWKVLLLYQFPRKMNFIFIYKNRWMLLYARYVFLQKTHVSELFCWKYVLRWIIYWSVIMFCLNSIFHFNIVSFSMILFEIQIQYKGGFWYFLEILTLLSLRPFLEELVRISLRKKVPVIGMLFRKYIGRHREHCKRMKSNFFGFFLT